MKTVRLFCAIGAVWTSSSCERAPSVDVLGSFFPIWIFCIAAGIFLTVLARRIFVRLRIDSELGPVVVIYPCLTAFFAFVIWLIFFR